MGRGEGGRKGRKKWLCCVSCDAWFLRTALVGVECRRNEEWEERVLTELEATPPLPPPPPPPATTTTTTTTKQAYCCKVKKGAGREKEGQARKGP